MTSHRPGGLIPALVLLLVAAACTAVDPSGFNSRSADSSASGEPTATPTMSEEASRKPTAQPTDGLGEFGCSFPVSGVGTVTRAQITDVRVGTHAGYDRVVFEFDAGIPQFNLDEATPPLLQDPSGLELAVEGEAFLRLVMQGGTAVSPEGVKTYRGPTDFKRDFPKLAELISGGDFEAVSSWYVGMTAASCVRILTLSGPSRIVIDIEH